MNPRYAPTLVTPLCAVSGGQGPRSARLGRRRLSQVGRSNGCNKCNGCNGCKECNRGPRRWAASRASCGSVLAVAPCELWLRASCGSVLAVAPVISPASGPLPRVRVLPRGLCRQSRASSHVWHSAKELAKSHGDSGGGAGASSGGGKGWGQRGGGRLWTENEVGGEGEEEEEAAGGDDEDDGAPYDQGYVTSYDKDGDGKLNAAELADHLVPQHSQLHDVTAAQSRPRALVIN